VIATQRPSTQRPVLHSGTVRVGRLQIHHTHGGRGSPPVVLIHGLGSAGYMEWRYTMPSLAARHRIFAPDLPGFGRSQKPRTRYGISFFARVVAGYMESRRLRNAVIVGSSMGGRIALELALHHPARVSRLVLVNALGLGRPTIQFYYPLMMLPRVGEAVMQVAREAINRMPADILRRIAGRYIGASSDLDKAMDDEYLEFLREMYAAEGYTDAYLATIRSLARPLAQVGGHDLSGRLSEIKVPTLLVWGADDPMFPVEHAVRAHTAIAGSQLAIIEGAGHTPQAERPAEFNRILGRFLGG
jgi:pimeloyl-ACP methyl ester carboxylesterase